MIAAYVKFGIVLQSALYFRKDESPVKKLPIVATPFHQCAISHFCRMQSKHYSGARTFYVCLMCVFVCKCVFSPDSYLNRAPGSENSFLSYFALIHCSLSTLSKHR